MDVLAPLSDSAWQGASAIIGILAFFASVYYYLLELHANEPAMLKLLRNRLMMLWTFLAFGGFFSTFITGWLGAAIMMIGGIVVGFSLLVDPRTFPDAGPNPGGGSRLFLSMLGAALIIGDIWLLAEALTILSKCTNIFYCR